MLVYRLPRLQQVQETATDEKFTNTAPIFISETKPTTSNNIEHVKPTLADSARDG
jgi:hypothetical protein